jgi:hypothetical protein
MATSTLHLYMSGWKRISHREAIKTKAFWLRYGMCLAQVLVIVAYFLPWERVYAQVPYPSGLLETMYSELTHNPTQLKALFNASLIVFFTAAIISFLLTMFVLTKKREHASVLRASWMLSSLAIVGPLLFLHWYLPWPIGSTDLSHLWPLITEMAIGWYVALFSGLVTFVLALYLYHEACRASREDSDLGDGRLPRTRKTTFLVASFLVIVIGCIAIVAVFFMVWNSGSASSMYGQTSYSNSGFETSLLMYLVPIAAVLSSSLLILGLFAGRTKNPVFSQAVLNTLIVAFALTLFWGVVFGEYRHLTVSHLFTAELQLGWYLCVISQFIVLSALFLYHRLWFAISGDGITLHSENASG